MPSKPHTPQGSVLTTFRSSTAPASARACRRTNAEPLAENTGPDCWPRSDEPAGRCPSFNTPFSGGAARHPQRRLHFGGEPRSGARNSRPSSLRRNDPPKPRRAEALRPARRSHFPLQPRPGPSFPGKISLVVPDCNNCRRHRLSSLPRAPVFSQSRKQKMHYQHFPPSVVAMLAPPYTRPSA